MAGAIPKHRGVQRMLECPVCMSTYNTRDRLPQVLGCHHTLCVTCLEHMAKYSRVLCPKCRQETAVDDVGTNYTLRDILDALCEVCLSQDREEVCGHCQRRFCSSCLEKHSKTLHEDLNNELDELSKELLECVDLSKDSTRILEIQAQTDDLCSQIRSTFAAKRETLDDYEKKLLAQVMDLHEEQIQSHVKWRETLDAQIAKTKTFMDHTYGQIGVEYSQRSNIHDSVELQAACCGIFNQLKETKSPNKIQAKYLAIDCIYRELDQFVRVNDRDSMTEDNVGYITPDKPTQGDLITGISSIAKNSAATQTPDRQMLSSKTQTDFEFDSQPVPLGLADVTDAATHITATNPTHPTINPVISYRSAEFDCSIGIKGHGHGQFKKPWGIKQSHDGQIIVSDMLRHRIQVFDKNLHFLRMFGRRGSGSHQFQSPTGITINRHNEIFISDSENHRIQVCSLEGEFLHRFGSHGKQNGQFDGPLGIDHLDGHLYVCDFNNYRVQVVTTSGHFIRNFGPNHTGSQLFNHRPFSIKVTNTHKVLVGEIGEGRHGIHVFSLTGDYLALFPSQCPGWVRPVKPNGLAVDTQGNILLTDAKSVIRVLDDEGDFVHEIRSKDDPMYGPHGITVDQQGDILVCDLQNHRIVRFTIRHT